MSDHGQRSASTDGVSVGYSPRSQVGSLFEQPGAWTPRGLFTARVQRVFIERGTHLVECVAEHGGPGRPFNAIVSTPFITPEGRGFVAGIRKNTLCLVTASKGTSGSRFFAIGFYSENPKQWLKQDVQPGDVYMIGEGDGYLAALANGDIEARATDTLWTTWSADDEAIDSSSRTRVNSSYAGQERWDHWREAEGDLRSGDTRRSLTIRRSVDTATQEASYEEEQGRVLRTIGSAKTELVGVREVVGVDGTVLLREAFEVGGAINVETSKGVRLRLDGANVFIEPGDGGKVYINDPNKVAKEAARKGDATEGHDHQTIITRAGPFVATVSVVTNSDKIAQGSDAVRIG